jgi:transcription elongation factor GreA
MYVTKEGLEKLKKELEELKIKKRREISIRIKRAKEMGDLSENAEYSEAKEAQALNEARIAELEEKLKEAVIVENNRRKDRVQIGSNLKVKLDNKTLTLTIVGGANESNPAEGKISHESPLGSALLGHKVGERVEVQLPSKKVACKILKIE